jgi:hypothetical protein
VRRWSGESGSAVVEFVGLAVLVIMPMSYLVLVMSHIYSATIATQHAAREAARAFSMSDTIDTADWAARTAAQLAFADHGLPLPPDALVLTCEGGCLQPGSTIHASVRWPVTLPWMPDILRAPTTVDVRADQVLVIDAYRGEP